MNDYGGWDEIPFDREDPVVEIEDDVHDGRTDPGLLTPTACATMGCTCHLGYAIGDRYTEAAQVIEHLAAIDELQERHAVARLAPCLA